MTDRPVTRLAAVVALLLGCGNGSTAAPAPGTDAAVDRPIADTGTIAPDAADDASDVGPDGGTAVVDSGPAWVPDVPTPDDAGSWGDGGESPFASTGPNTVATWSGALPGTANQAHVLYPSSGTDRVPVVFFAHGFQLAVNNYDALLTHVASWGYVVVSVDYPGTLLSTDHRDVAHAFTLARTALAAGVAGFPATSRLDLNHSAVMGHSLGGKGAIMALLDDPSFVAGVALDPVDDNPAPGGMATAAAPSIAPEQMGRLMRPLALFGGTQSRCSSPFTPCAPEASNYLQFFAAVPMGVPVGLYPLTNFGHNDFVDTACGFQCALCARGAAPLDSRLHALRALTVAFLQRFVRGDTSLDGYVSGDERARYVASGALWNLRANTLPACP